MSVEQIRTRLADINASKAHYEWKSDNAEGKLARHEVWRHDYLSYPYLIGATDDRIATRFRDIFINQTELGNKGKLGLIPLQTSDHFMMQKFTHMLEEYSSRGGGIPGNVIKSAREPVMRYFQNGGPIAVKMFTGYKEPSSLFLVKYGLQQFLQPMLRTGNLRICPASFYNNSNFLDSIKDNETHRVFHIPTFRERLDGKTFVEIQGYRLRFGDDDISIPVVVNDYYLFSLCDHIYYRLPTDFNADAALIIRDPIRFTQRVISTFLAKRPEWEPLYGPVTYYGNCSPSYAGRAKDRFCRVRRIASRAEIERRLAVSRVERMSA